MKILFLCSGLEPGRDGVGDYTRLLAGELTRLGHTCGLIALNDPHLQTATETAPRAGDKIGVLRLPATETWARRAALATDFRDRCNPDWISLQIVPYGLHHRGMVFAVSPTLQQLVSGRPLHIMFHELWTGGKGLSGLRHKLAGAVQRRGLKQMLALLRPQLVTTSNPAFIAKLKSIGTPASLLPLFGNVPVAPPVSPPVLPGLLAETGLPADGNGRAAWWVAVFFGTIHPEWKPEPFFGILRRVARRANKRVILLQLGRIGTRGDALWESLKRRYRSDFILLCLGEQPTEVISHLLQMADFGIAASPWHLIGKSGTAAAMLDHGLPVIVTRDDFRPPAPLEESPAPDPLLHRCDAALETKLLTGLAKRPVHPLAPEIAARLSRQMSTLTVLRS